MNSPEKDFLVSSRRRFIRQSACAALGYTGIVNALTQLTMVHSAVGQSAPTGYKALVVLFLFGGNDSTNMIIPRMGHPAYTGYKASRGILTMYDPADPARNGSPNASIPLTTADGSYGVHPAAQYLADLFHGGDLSFVANVGTLRYPVANKDAYLSGLIPVPTGLFGHEGQQIQWQSSLPDQPLRTGWGGRIADLLSTPASSSVSMSISLGGFNVFQRGLLSTTGQFSISPQGTVNLDGYGVNYASALNSDKTYKNTLEGQRLKAFEDIMRLTHANLLEEGYNSVVRGGRESEAQVGAAMTAANASGVNFNALFGSGTGGGMREQLRMIAKLIAGRNAIGNSRQIFFAGINGYDTHDGQMEAHSTLMTELSDSLRAFKAAMLALGVHDDVLLMTHSDFGRTLTPNKQSADVAGTDHGWGGHQIVMGGGVAGGRIFGNYPNLIIGGNLDTGNDRGRFIPTTSVDQYCAVAANWLGVNNNELGAIFPNLSRFNDPFGASANLRYMG